MLLVKIHRITVLVMLIVRFSVMCRFIVWCFCLCCLCFFMLMVLMIRVQVRCIIGICILGRTGNSNKIEADSVGPRADASQQS